MGEAADEWRAVVEPRFAFVAEYGFAITESDDSSSWMTSVTYTSSAAGIHVARSVEFNRSEVHLIRLVDGSVPPYPLFMTAAPMDWVLLDTVLEIRNPERSAKAQAFQGLSTAEVEQQLAFWAESIQTVALDFLQGDLSAIDQADALLRESPS